MKENFGVIRCSFHSNSWETNKAVPEAFAIISPKKHPSEENPSKTSTAKKSKSHTRTEDQLLFWLAPLHSSISAPIALNDKRNIYVLPYPFAATLHYH
jgi:hypothetical protein